MNQYIYRKEAFMKLDLTQMEYFINIVECGFNLSLASKKIHISQSALSQFVTNFERDNQIELFIRRKGRLVELTPIGEMIFNESQLILNQVSNLLNNIQREANKQKGTIRIGIPSLILRVYFSSFFTTYMFENPDIHIEIVEEGSIRLRKMLLDDEIDLAVLIDPTSLDTRHFNQQIIQMDEMAAFMDRKHPLAKKEKLEWQDIGSYPLATFYKSFTTQNLVTEKLKKIKSKSEIITTSASWDYLIEATTDNEMITILPSPVAEYCDPKTHVVKRFVDPLPFNFYICRRTQESYPVIENTIFFEIIDLFYQPKGER